MKIKSIIKTDKLTDHVIYTDTDSIFVTTVPMMDLRYQDWSTGTADEIAVKVNEFASEMQDYLNDFYDILAPRVFNVPVDKHRLEIKKEYVAKSGIWIAKKRYAQWIISDNGVPVDKLDVKGLDVVRSSFPKAFGELMSTVLITILRSGTQSELRDMIMEFKHSMTTLDINDVSKNSSVKGLSKYKSDLGLFRTKKGATAHGKAAVVYNDMLVHYKTAYKYSPIKNGDKIKWAYVKNNPLGVEAVAFKGYQDPVEITDFIKTYIDYDKIFERELHKKLQDFYDALGWGQVVNEQKKAAAFFSFV